MENLVKLVHNLSIKGKLIRKDRPIPESPPKPSPLFRLCQLTVWQANGGCSSPRTGFACNSFGRNGGVCQTLRFDNKPNRFGKRDIPTSFRL